MDIMRPPRRRTPILLIVAGLIGWLASVATLIWVAAHFVAKYW